MKYVRFETRGLPAFGRLDGDTVVEIDGSPFLSPKETGKRYKLADIRLLAPCRPSKIFAMAGNYVDHLGSAPIPEEPKPFLKVPSSVIAPHDTILLPRGQNRVDEEAELVVVIGKPCRRVSRREALDYVFGYTCGNDVSARDWQKADLNWWRAKSSDTFTPLGPCLVTDIDASGLNITARINGEIVQRCNTSDLIHDIGTLIEFISASVTLEPEDLIFTGTAGAPAPLHDGDTVEVEIDEIGILTNPVKLEGE